MLDCATNGYNCKRFYTNFWAKCLAIVASDDTTFHAAVQAHDALGQIFIKVLKFDISLGTTNYETR